MIVEQFRFAQHEKMMRELLIGRGMSEKFIDDLPIHGKIAWEKEGQAISAGFLRLMEGRYGLLDSFITDPKASSEARFEANRLVAEGLLDVARRLQLYRVFAFSLDGHFVDRSKTLGFQSVPYHFYMLTLGDEKCHF